MTTVEQRLAEAIEQVRIPPVDLVQPVLDRIDFAPVDRRPARRRPPTPAIVGLMALVVAVTTATVAPARQAVADWLGIGATEIQIEPDRPIPSDRNSGQTLGRPVPADPRPSVDPIPALGPPAATFDDPGRGRSYSWPPGPGLPAVEADVGLVFSVRRVDEAERSVKAVAADGEVEFVTVESATGTWPGLWLPGSHTYLAAGSDRPVAAQRVLLWVADGLEYRLESDLSLARSRELAKSIDGGTDLLPAG